jgi:hypothetical protein
VFPWQHCSVRGIFYMDKLQTLSKGFNGLTYYYIFY